MSRPPELRRGPLEPRRGRGLGLRREMAILPPVALLLLAVVSTFTLLSYRSSLALLADERRDEAAALARTVAEVLSEASAEPSAAELRRLAPGALAVAVLDAAGQPRAAAGDLLAAPLSPPAPEGEAGDAAAGFGPDADFPDRVAGFAPLPAGGRVRVDLAAGALVGQLRGVRVLTAVVLAVNGGLLILVFLFQRHLLAPFTALLERAREVRPAASGAGQGEDEDEIAFLLNTFDRALAALGERERTVEDDIAALERTLAPSLQSGLLLLGREGDVLALNPAGAEMLGVTEVRLGLPLAEALAGQVELAQVLGELVARRRELQRHEHEVRTPAGVRTLGLTAHPLRRDDGEVRGYVVLFADLTSARRRAEESRLAESLAQLGEMAGGVAHELRNSLATLSGYLTLIERRPDEGTIADYLGEIRQEADHLERVLDDFLAFARPGTARVEEIPLAGLLRRTAADPALGGVEVALRLDPALPEPRLQGDRQLLERALSNLLRNAAEAERAAGRAGPVEVGLGGDGEGLEISIADRGGGIPPEVRERLFHPFATGRPGGVGLGLALAHRIVALHGGRLAIEDRPGGGTRAVVSLPRGIVVTERNTTTG